MIKGSMVDITYGSKFQYTHKNPYHEKLGQFDQFVLRDHDAESYSGKWNSTIFKRSAPIAAEIGSGYGQFMQLYSQQNPEVNFVGMDYRFKRSFNLAKKLSQLEHQNFRYLRAKGERLHFIFEPSELSKIFYFFPDPWPKKRHHKKRLFQKPFIESCFKVLAPGGKIYIKTDHSGYAQWMREVIESETQGKFKCHLDTSHLWELQPKADEDIQFLTSFKTKFEKIFLSQGTNIHAFVLESLKPQVEN